MYYKKGVHQVFSSYDAALFGRPHDKVCDDDEGGE